MHGKTAHPDGMINKCIHQYEALGSMLYIKKNIWFLRLETDICLKMVHIIL